MFPSTLHWIEIKPTIRGCSVTTLHNAMSVWSVWDTSEEESYCVVKSVWFGTCPEWPNAGEMFMIYLQAIIMFPRFVCYIVHMIIQCRE